MTARGGEYDVAVIGGGLLGAAIAWGVARLGERVAVLDEGDAAVRASRGNFALVWVQSKGLGLPEYSHWTVRSSNAWAAFAAELRSETGLDVRFERPGGFFLCLSEAEYEARADVLKRMHNQAGFAQYEAVMMRRAEVQRFLPDIGPEVVGGSYSPMDGHVNSLRLLRALHVGIQRRGACAYLSSHRVERIEFKGGEFRLLSPGGEVRARKIVLAAGNANMQLAPMVGLEAPMAPERGQIIVTERVRPFLRHPLVTCRQSDEGTVMIGDSREEGTSPDDWTRDVASVEADRAVRMFPLLGRVNVVRSWTAIRVMPKDGFPIYNQSTAHPGAFVTCCHSGVTLAANHALTLAPMIVKGALGDELKPFSARRFDVQQAAAGVSGRGW